MKQKFDKKSYEDLLKYILKSNLSICSFNNAHLNERSIIIRHDVDYCPLLALDLALIETKYNISSTFFFLLSSNFYNIISKQKKGLVFMLWGNYAKGKEKYINENEHLILKSGHPSPLSANKGFWFGNNHFKKCNEFLIKNNSAPVKWI